MPVLHANTARRVSGAEQLPPAQSKIICLDDVSNTNESAQSKICRTPTTSLDGIVASMLYYARHEYKGDMQSRHLAVAVYRNRCVSNYIHNTRIPCVLPTPHKTCHAELGVLYTLTRRFKINQSIFCNVPSKPPYVQRSLA
jgi:hypothetical protein